MRVINIKIHACIIDDDVDALGTLLPDDLREVGDAVGFRDVEGVPLDGGVGGGFDGGDGGRLGCGAGVAAAGVDHEGFEGWVGGEVADEGEAETAAGAGYDYGGG